MSNFHFLAMMHNATMNVSCTSFSGDACFCFPRSGIAVSRGYSMSDLFEELIKAFSKWLHHFTISAAMCEGSRFPTSLPILVIVCLLYHRHSSGCEVVSHCGFDLLFPDQRC